jgi:hypothetical protein
MLRGLLLTTLIFAISTFCFSAESVNDTDNFNVKCPAMKLSSTIDNYYHECHAAHLKPEYNSCEKFVETFKILMPTADFARVIDLSGNPKYVVPALWLLGEAQFEDYFSLIHDLAFNSFYSTPFYLKAKNEATTLFFSDSFKEVLDAHGEEYEDEWAAGDVRDKSPSMKKPPNNHHFDVEPAKTNPL